MQHIRQVRPSDASGDVPVRRWKRFKRRVDELPEPELFGSDDGAPAVPFTSSQCEVYNTLDSMDCLLDAVKVADFMGDDEKMTMLATAAMTSATHDSAELERVCLRLPDNAIRAVLATPAFRPLDITRDLLALMSHRVAREYIDWGPVRADNLRGFPGAFGCLLPACCAHEVTSLRIRSYPHTSIDKTLFRCYPNVTELSISSNSLTILGDIFPDQLRVLEVVDCQALCKIYGAVGNKKLTKLVVRMCPRFDALPPVICDCALLSHLDLSYTGLETLTPCIGECRRLVTLILTSCVKLATITDRIGACVLLEVVDASFCETLSALPESLCNCIAMKELDISHSGVRVLPSHIGRCSALEKLKFDRTPLASIPESIGDCVKLHELVVNPASAHPFNHQMSLPERIGDCAMLSTLVVKDHRITTIPERIGDCESLRDLMVKDAWISTLPSRIGDCVHLRSICIVHASHLSSLPDRIGDCAELRYLAVCWCYGFETLPERIGECGKLEKINLHGSGVRQLPESLTKCESLTLIDLSLCRRIVSLPVGVAQKDPEKLRVLGVSPTMRTACMLPRRVTRSQTQA